MPKQTLLHVGFADLSPVRVVHKLCIFPGSNDRPYKKIRAAFHSLREWAIGFGLDPDDLLHIGVPTTDEKGLSTYDCCIEFPLPIDDEDEGIELKSLTGGMYAVLRIEKKTPIISKAIKQFHRDYVPENQILIDESRPVYEIYFDESMEYCVPIHA